MDDKVKALCVRLVDTVGQTADPDWFADDDAWAFLVELVELDKKGQRLSPASLQVLLDLGLAIGLKPGAPEGAFLPALEQQFGPCPHPPELVVDLVRFVRREVNGSFEDSPRPSNKLAGESATPLTPHKNYEYS